MRTDDPTPPAPPAEPPPVPGRDEPLTDGEVREIRQEPEPDAENLVPVKHEPGTL